MAFFFPDVRVARVLRNTLFAVANFVLDCHFVNLLYYPKKSSNLQASHGERNNPFVCSSGFPLGLTLHFSYFISYQVDLMITPFYKTFT